MHLILASHHGRIEDVPSKAVSAMEQYRIDEEGSFCVDPASRVEEEELGSRFNITSSTGSPGPHRTLLCERLCTEHGDLDMLPLSFLLGRSWRSAQSTEMAGSSLTDTWHTHGGRLEEPHA